MRRIRVEDYEHCGIMYKRITDTKTGRNATCSARMMDSIYKAINECLERKHYAPDYYPLTTRMKIETLFNQPEIFAIVKQEVLATSGRKNLTQALRREITLEVINLYLKEVV